MGRTTTCDCSAVPCAGQLWPQTPCSFWLWLLCLLVHGPRPRGGEEGERSEGVRCCCSAPAATLTGGSPELCIAYAKSLLATPFLLPPCVDGGLFCAHDLETMTPSSPGLLLKLLQVLVVWLEACRPSLVGLGSLWWVMNRKFTDWQLYLLTSCLGGFPIVADVKPSSAKRIWSIKRHIRMQPFGASMHTRAPLCK